jgi:RNA polymerase sigma-70 factor (ECF subfamily)
MTDTELLLSLRRRDPNAARALYDAYRDRIFAVTVRVLRDEWDAEEATHDALFTVVNKIDLFHEQCALWSWIYRVAENCARMKLRTFKRRPILVESDTLSAMMAPAAMENTSDRPDDQLRERRCVEAYAAGLMEIEETNRSLYVAMDLDGRSKEEVAAELSLTIPALKARLHRVREGLKARMLAVA